MAVDRKGIWPVKTPPRGSLLGDLVESGVTSVKKDS